ncbi:MULTISPECIES: hypothetical protein [Chromohalobacter]|jgi:hypothetical protein|uniref:Lipoprotein n=1 Tax=Chromohalobacter israelensis (strain ATCC BAA-138 / DSM 3043 / CIP 106854 / NCIMB 13768 / 1H11) TaxID=290398 RepID=Q1QTB3_CHRI1|nr:MULTISPECIES: hypothetical protein [Chromohalobacter]ABE60295.1 hypothetical protein Csal_2950 [Chromohalobacter salexigens DSM 3043]MBZ5876531.1 hypothetical protein [Chromohalobacter salexigens]MDF9434735.1 hypothetical protein [Chromohalobacter israelensis]MDO0946157.1 hypothetical protein [Chromohalobacter salexigens]NQY45260.1 hypothetical protein [Chromohalobacter sp.]
MMRLVATLIVMLGLVGCATSPQPPQPREIVVRAEPQAALEAGVAMLASRGFVIRRADAELGDVEAVLASRPPLTVRYRLDATPAGTRIALSGRRGGQPVAPYVFDTLLVDIQARLGESP